ncbi:hypothetical protein [Nostoc sp. ChiQUE01b]|uniref:hypothetical protein n=1 Tax=Nostoc sp. ChiQUE01b TaxID=3075376 RepID=UPI002AD29053|nr:hypothetical protein [Nostoc sp. ChiQUE01b]
MLLAVAGRLARAEYNPIVKTRGLKQGHIVLKNRSTWGFAQDRVFRFFTACRVPLKNIFIFS